MKISHPYPDSLPAEMGPLSPRDPSAPKVDIEYSHEHESWRALISMGPLRYSFWYRTKEEFIDRLGAACEALRQGFGGQGPRIMNVSPRP